MSSWLFAVALWASAVVGPGAEEVDDLKKTLRIASCQ
jgi:hypothetical protein